MSGDLKQTVAFSLSATSPHEKAEHTTGIHYGSIHFRFDQEAGAELGRDVGGQVYRHNLQRDHDREHDGEEDCDYEHDRHNDWK